MNPVGGIGGGGSLEQIIALRQQIIDRSKVLTDLHQLDVSGVSLIKFKHRKLRVMESTHPFVTEVPVDFEYPLESTNHQTFEV